MTTNQHHCIEEQVIVPLRWNAEHEKWEVHLERCGAGPLDSAIDPVERGMGCPCPRTDELPGPGYGEVPVWERVAREEHEWVLDRAEACALPSAEALAELLASALGWAVVAPGCQGWPELVSAWAALGVHEVAVGEACAAGDWGAESALNDMLAEVQQGVVDAVAMLLPMLGPRGAGSP